MKYRIIFLSLGLVSGYFIAQFLNIFGEAPMSKVHVLEYPLLLESDGETGNMHMLPKGATLYFDSAFAEGFTRYKVYINVDRFPLPLTELKDPSEIRPIEAYAPSLDEIKKLIGQYPISKADLASILKSSLLSKEEIRSLLEEYSK